MNWFREWWVTIGLHFGWEEAMMQRMSEQVLEVVRENPQFEAECKAILRERLRLHSREEVLKALEEWARSGDELSRLSLDWLVELEMDEREKGEKD